VIYINGHPAEYSSSDTKKEKMYLFVQSLFGSRNAGCVSPTSPDMVNWDRHKDQSPNTVRLGECSEHGFGTFPRNYSADVTIDEMYMWRINQPYDNYTYPTKIEEETHQLLKKGRSVWYAGRYYRPALNSGATGGGKVTDAVFTSAPIYPRPRNLRNLPPPSNSEITSSSVSLPAERRAPGETKTQATVGVPDKGRLLGISWTWYAEDYSRADGAPIVYDWYQKWEDFGQSSSGGGGSSGDGDDIDVVPVGGGAKAGPGTNSQDKLAPLYPSPSTMRYNPEVGKVTPKMLKQDGSLCSIALSLYEKDGSLRRRLAGKDEDGYTDAGYSVISDDQTGTPFAEFGISGSWKYDVRFRIKGTTANSILLATPVFDDITFFYTTGAPEYLTWWASSIVE